jgi:hypothetical protein
MKKTTILLAAIIACMVAGYSHAETVDQFANAMGPIPMEDMLVQPTTGGSASDTNTPPAPSPFSLPSITNISFTVYVEKGIGSQPVKWGGGGLIAYNFNQFVGTGLGFDYMGQAMEVNGQVTLQAPIALSAIGLTNVFATPWAFAGLGTPFSGTAGSSVAAIAGGGAVVRFGHVLGGTLYAGAGYVNWTGAGKYSGDRLVFPFGYQHGL